MCEDGEIEYVNTTSKAKISSLEKINVTGYNSIFTKLNEYPFEFEINNSLQLASINGVKIADTGTENKTVKELQDKITALESKIEVMSSAITVHYNENSYQQITTTYTKVPLNGVLCQSGTRLTTHNGGIKVGKGVNYVEVSGFISIDCRAEGEISGVIYKGTEDVAGGSAMKSYSNGIEGMALKSYIINVQEGDELYFYIGDMYNSKSFINADYPRQTLLTVRAIQ